MPLLQAGQLKRVQVKVLTGNPDVGWQASGESWVFSSYNSTTNIGVVTVPSDATTKYMFGMFVRIAQTTGGTKYGKILGVTSTTLTIWMPGFTLNNEAINTSSYSPLAHPVGIPSNISDGQPYMFAARETSGVSVDTGTTIPFDTEDYDPVNCYNPANGLFTAPFAGRYHFDSSINIQGVSSGATWGGWQKNGAQFMRYNRIDGTPGTVYAPSGGIDIYLAAGDTFGSSIQFTTGGSKALEAGWSYFNGHLVSRV